SGRIRALLPDTGGQWRILVLDGGTHDHLELAVTTDPGQSVDIAQLFTDVTEQPQGPVFSDDIPEVVVGVADARLTAEVPDVVEGDQELRYSLRGLPRGARIHRRTGGIARQRPVEGTFTAAPPAHTPEAAADTAAEESRHPRSCDTASVVSPAALASIAAPARSPGRDRSKEPSPPSSRPIPGRPPPSRRWRCASVSTGTRRSSERANPSIRSRAMCRGRRPGSRQRKSWLAPIPRCSAMTTSSKRCWPTSSSLRQSSSCSTRSWRTGAWTTPRCSSMRTSICPQPTWSTTIPIPAPGTGRQWI